MEIDPVILVPGAAVAVLVMILYIRLIAGRREAVLDEAGLRSFLALQAPEVTPEQLLIGEDGKAALVFFRETEEAGLVRCFGDKLVLQSLSPAVISKFDRERAYDGFRIPRQGLAHPPLAFRAETGSGDATLTEEPVTP